jgi:hypothetical protein
MPIWMANCLQCRPSIAVPRRTRSLVNSSIVTRQVKRIRRDTEDTPTQPMPPLPPLPRDGSGTDVPASGDGSGPMTIGPDGRPTLQLSPVEIEALAQGSLETRPVHDDIRTTLTVENVRLALGSTSMPPARFPPEGLDAADAADAADAPDAPDAPDASDPPDRGPRRARETLRVETIKAQPVTPAAPPRKR